jgi:thrombospondin type-1 domain-containing protein 4
LTSGFHFDISYSRLQAVHKSGVISGAFMNNGAVRCGDQICRPVSGLFTKNPLPEGYVHVATIPAGASNITITELKNSMNLLGEFVFVVPTLQISN